MPYAASDARSQLAPTTAAKPAAQAASADYLRFYDTPGEELDGGRRWRSRSQNLVTDFLEVEPGLRLEYAGGPDETGLLLITPDGRARVTAGDASAEVSGESLTFIPPGPAVVEFLSPGRAVVLSTTRAGDLAASAMNSDSYASPHPNVAPLVPWPEPVGGYQLRTYDLDVPGLDNPPFRLFRCSSFMVNYVKPRVGPRETTKMSPHDHADFEQLSLILRGEFVHHIRWPWTTDLDEWRADEHEHCGTPSLTIIPPPVLHTSQAIGTGENQLIDLFSPPRLDFSKQEGWVLNAADYPMPDAGDQ